MIARVSLGLLALGACGRDIQLGTSLDAASDAALDAVASPFTAGAYTASFLDPPQVMCAGSLARLEADFSGITRANSALVDGTVTFTPTTDQLAISGAPIQSGFPTATITVVPDTTSNPPTLWDMSVNGSFGSGPDATTIVSIALAIDSATAQAASGIQSGYAQLFETADTLGQCSVTFGALFVRS
jgi:hypothetical protein